MNKSINKAKKIDERKFLIEKYDRIKMTLMRVCYDCGIPFDEYFSAFNNASVNDLLDVQIRDFTKEMEENIKDLTKEYFLASWYNVIDRSFDGEQKTSMNELLTTMLEREPASVYISFSNTYEALVRLNNAVEKETALNFLEDYCSNSSIEEVTNIYGMLFYSKYREEAIDAVKKGFEKNNNVNYEYVSAYFGEEKPNSQFGE